MKKKIRTESKENIIKKVLKINAFLEKNTDFPNKNWEKYQTLLDYRKSLCTELLRRDEEAVKHFHT